MDKLFDFFSQNILYSKVFIKKSYFSYNIFNITQKRSSIFYKFYQSMIQNLTLNLKHITNPLLKIIHEQVQQQTSQNHDKKIKNQIPKTLNKKTFLSNLVENFNVDFIEQMLRLPTKTNNLSNNNQISIKNEQSINKNLFYNQNNQQQKIPTKLSKPPILSYQTPQINNSKEEHFLRNNKIYQKININKKHSSTRENNRNNIKSQNLSFHKDQIIIDQFKISLHEDNIKINSQSIDEQDNNNKYNINFKPIVQVFQVLNLKSKQSKQLKQSKHKYQLKQVFIQDQWQNSNCSIEEFQQIKVLGQGVYGRVSLSRHKKSNFLVAIKRISKASLTSENLVYLCREIKIQSFANHPNISQLYSFFSDNNNIYLVLEVCQDGTLLEVLRQEGKLKQESVRKYIKQVCKAVQFLHDNQIIHRDIKPQNILIQNGVAKICDFGWSVYAPQLRNTLCGTPLYSCPQIIKNQKYDNKIDIWSIGIMTYELIFGQVPFQITTKQDLYKVVQDKIDFPDTSTLTQECKNFISRCLQKDPRDRYEIWQLLRHPFIKQQQKIRDSLKVSLDLQR